MDELKDQTITSRLTPSTMATQYHQNIFDPVHQGLYNAYITVIQARRGQG